MHSNNN